jgi:hypothetical protein
MVNHRYKENVCVRCGVVRSYMRNQNKTVLYDGSPLKPPCIFKTLDRGTSKTSKN